MTSLLSSLMKNSRLIWYIFYLWPVINFLQEGLVYFSEKWYFKISFWLPEWGGWWVNCEIRIDIYTLLLLLSHLSLVWLCATLCTAALQASLSMESCRQEYWSVLPCTPPGDLPDSGVEPKSIALQADSLPLSYQGSPIYTLLLLLLSHFSRVWLLGTPWTAAYQAPLSMGFSRQEYWSGVPLPSLIYTLLYIK